MATTAKISTTGPQWHKLLADIDIVWQEIGSDVEALSAEMGERTTTAIRVEACLDADRMTTIANAPDSDAYVNELCKAHGYAAVARAVAKCWRP